MSLYGDRRVWVDIATNQIGFPDGDRSADGIASGRDFAVGEGAVAAGRTMAAARTAGGRAGEPSWLRSCNVTFSPGRIFAMSGPHGAGGPHGTPLHLGARSRHRRRAPRRALLHGGGTGKSVARCHRTELAYWKIESISLQR